MLRLLSTDSTLILAIHSFTHSTQNNQDFERVHEFGVTKAIGADVHRGELVRLDLARNQGIVAEDRHKFSLLTLLRAHAVARCSKPFPLRLPLFLPRSRSLFSLASLPLLGIASFGHLS